MSRVNAIALFIHLSSLFIFPELFAQRNTPGPNVIKPKLKSWKESGCDNAYDPDLLINRITSMDVRNGVTFLTVSFSDQCCPDFAPAVSFKENRLTIVPYAKPPESICLCDCCFAIEFQIDGLPSEPYEIYFKNQQIQRSDDPYPVKESMSGMYEGKIVNRTNRYGFKEGRWLSFFSNGKIMWDDQYPESGSLRHTEPITQKKYDSAGNLTFYYSPDTVMAWFEDGMIKSSRIDFVRGDTIYTKSFQLYENRTLKEKKLFMGIKTTLKNSKGVSVPFKRYEQVSHEEYFENGKPKYLYQPDTSIIWFRSGLVKHKQYSNGSITYDSLGHTSQRQFFWNRQTVDWNWEHHLYVDYFLSGRVRHILYTRDEPQKKRAIAPGVRYEWNWDESGHVKSSPKRWKGPLPWEGFVDL